MSKPEGDAAVLAWGGRFYKWEDGRWVDQKTGVNRTDFVDKRILKGKGYFNDHLTNGARQSRQLLYAHIGVRCVPARVPRVIARSVPSCCTVPAVAFCS